MDRLSPFFSHFTLSARVFFSGKLCGVSSDHVTKSAGHLHVLRSGVLKILQPCCEPVIISEPTVLLYPRAVNHTFQSEGADILCAFVEFGTGMMNPLATGLPNLLTISLASVPALEPTVALLFAEAFDYKDGRQVAVDRLAEYFLLLVLRSAIDSKLIQGGVLSALSDSRLAKALMAIHAQPDRAFSLEGLAHIAGMSRARFASHFLATVGRTPFEYLTVWRIGVAQSLLKKGESLKMIAPTVGYASTAALIRSFSQHVGLPPMAWLADQQRSEGN